MNRPLPFPALVDTSPACPCCGDADRECDCVTCGRCRETVRPQDAVWYGWLSRDGAHVCHGCEWDMRLGGRL